MRKLPMSLLICLGAAVAATGIGLLPFVQTVELKTYDLRVRATADPAGARRDIVLVNIDESSIRNLEPVVGRWPWPRLAHAQLVNFLARGPAKVVAYDVLFSERDRSAFELGEEQWTGEESDRAFVESVTKAGNVVLAADATREEPAVAEPGGTQEGSLEALARQPAYRLDGPLEERPVLTLPFDELARAARAIGHTYFAFDPDGPVRRSVPFIRVRGRAVASLAAATAAAATGLPPDNVRLESRALVFGRSRMPLVETRAATSGGAQQPALRALVRFAGPAASDAGKPIYDEYPFYRLFYSEQQLLAGEKPLVDPAAFKGKVVVVGVTAAGLHDVFTVPFAAGKMPGMEIHANVVDNILSGRFTAPSGRPVAVALVVGSAAIVAFAAVLVGTWWAIGAAAAVLVALGGVAFAAFARGAWLPVVQPGFATLAAMFAGVTYQYLVEGREKRHVKRLFSRFVAEDIYKHLLANPGEAKLGGERRLVTVLFSDIRGFTTMSEGARAEEVVAQLNEHFTRMVEILFAHHGTIDKFVGDMVMALFGAPVDDPEQADHAVQAALDMVRALDDLNERWAREGKPRLRIGVGINTGEMIAGNIGSERVMSYTVIGDAVNLGSRLESLNKEYGTTIVISEHTAKRLKGQYGLRPRGDVIVKGKREAVTVYEVIAGTSEAARTK